MFQLYVISVMVKVKAVHSGTSKSRTVWPEVVGQGESCVGFEK